MKQALIFILFLFLIFDNVTLRAQQKHIARDKKAVSYFEKAKTYFRKKKIDKAEKYFKKAIKREPAFLEPYLYLATIDFEKKDYQGAKRYYSEILKRDSAYNNNVYYSLAAVNEKSGDLEEALKYYRLFLTKDGTNAVYRKRALKAIPLLSFRIEAYRHPVKFTPVNLGDSINTLEDEFPPVLTGDNSLMIFTRRVYPVGGAAQEDFYMSENKGGIWSKAVPVRELNTPWNEGAQTISPDGKTMIFTVCGRGRTYGSCDLVVTYKKNGRWTRPKNMGRLINTPYWESQPSLSADGNILYFSSNRPGGAGGDDIWYTVKDTAGRWRKPVCLDTTVNTAFDENTPFIHPDTKTLYFTSNGLPGMGGKDIFMTKKENGQWTKPVNLGYPVNTPDEEAGLFVSFDGEKAYFSTDKLTKGKTKNLDIYYFILPKNLRPQKITYIKGIVVDAQSRIPLPAEINIYDNNTGKLLRRIKSSRDSFFVTLPAGVDYNLTVTKKGYAFYSERFAIDTAKVSALRPYRLTIPLIKLEDSLRADSASAPVVLRNIFFEFNSAKLDTLKSAVELQNLYNLLKQNPEVKILITGHTDNIGSEEYNRQLSLDRAKAIYDYLVRHGIDESRLQYQGLGASHPVDTNATAEGRSRNRRVEFVILKS